MAAFLFILALSLQCTVTLFAAGDYKGLSLNSADFLLPLAGPAVLFSLLTRRAQWPRWHIPYGYTALAILTAVMAMGLYNGYLATGEWSRWAVMNKGAGWLVLMAYCLLGAWLTTNYGPDAFQKTLRPFLTFFVLFLTALVVFCVLRDFDFNIPLSFLDEQRLRIAGLSGNRNAYGFLLCAALCFMTWPALNRKPLCPPYLFYLFWSILPLALIYNNSRAAALAVIVLLALFTALRFKATLKMIAPPLCAGLLLAAIVLTASGTTIFRENQINKMKAVYELADENNLTYETLYKRNLKHQSESARIRVLNDSLALWKQSPLDGIGIGSFLYDQHERYKGREKEYPVDIIDCTPLWLLTETGLIGVAVFALFYVQALHRLWLNRESPPDDPLTVFRQAVALMLLAFAAMSLFHELLYARFLWLFIGMGLAAPVNKTQ